VLRRKIALLLVGRFNTPLVIDNRSHPRVIRHLFWKLKEPTNRLGLVGPYFSDSFALSLTVVGKDTNVLEAIRRW
jgi:hypothetical protein